MKILVLGGTGAMGKHLVNMLARQDNHVVVTSRTRYGFHNNIQYVTGNARNHKFIKELLNHRWDVIIDFMVYSSDTFQQRYKQLLSSTGHYIYLSSARVYASSEKPINENSPRLLDVTDDKSYLATDEYALSKARQENLLFDSTTKNWSIVRPYLTYSDERLQLGVLEKEDWLYRALQGKTIVAASEIQSKLTTLTFGSDVARGIASILCHRDTKGEAFHITSGISIRWSEVLDIYINELKSHLTYSPNVCLQDLDSFMQWHSGKYQVLYDRLYDRLFDNSKINKYIDISSFISPQTGLVNSLKEFINIDKPQFNLPNWRAEAIKDRMLNEYTPLAEIPDLKQKFRYYLYRHFLSCKQPSG